MNVGILLSDVRITPPLNQLRAFEAAGRHLNFRLAAEELGVTQGAVAQQVRALEAGLGLHLFDRLPRGVCLTETGQGYHERITQAFAIISDASRDLRPTPSKVTISVTSTFASRWLIPNLPEFTSRHPDVDLRISATDRISSFQHDGIDLAVRHAQPPFGAAMRAELLFRQDIIAVCAPSLMPQPTDEAHRDMAEAPLSGMDLLHDTHKYWPRFLGQVPGQAIVPAAHGVEFSQTTLCIEAALAGQGVALASRFMVARDIAEGRLIQPVPQVLKGARDFYLLMPRQPRPSAAILAVWDWLAEQKQP